MWWWIGGIWILCALLNIWFIRSQLEAPWYMQIIITAGGPFGTAFLFWLGLQMNTDI